MIPIAIWGAIITVVFGVIGYVIRKLIIDRITKLETRFDNGINSKISELEKQTAVLKQRLDDRDTLAEKVEQLLEELK